MDKKIYSSPDKFITRILTTTNLVFDEQENLPASFDLFTSAGEMDNSNVMHLIVTFQSSMTQIPYDDN